MTRRLRAAARPFGHGGDKVQIVYELIASVADASPGADGDYSHFIPQSYVQTLRPRRATQQRAAGARPAAGTQSFLTQARHFRWALRKPLVGLALDPEWRMGPHQVPAQTIGSVKAAEVNQVSALV